MVSTLKKSMIKESNGSGCKILLVDDQTYMLNSYRCYLDESYNVILANGGEKALAALKKYNDIAVIVSDIHMPGMDGMQLFMKCKKEYPDITRVFLTGDIDQHTALRAINQCEIYRLLNKPCSSDQLSEVLIPSIEKYKNALLCKKLMNEASRSLSIDNVNPLVKNY